MTTTPGVDPREQLVLGLDPDFPTFMNYHCIVHQQAICGTVMGFRILEECSANYGSLLLHTDIRWLSKGKVLQRFLSLLSEIKTFMESREEDATLLSDPEWLLDLAFLTDVTEKLKNLNLQLQGKDKNI